METGGKGFAQALAILSRRDHSEAELTRKLAAKGVAPAELGEVLARLRAAGYLNDRRLAERWAETLAESGRGVGPRLRQELLKRGIPRDMVAEIVQKTTEEHNEAQILSALLARKFPRFSPESADQGEKRRIVSFCMRRGFSMATIMQSFQSHEEL